MACPQQPAAPHTAVNRWLLIPAGILILLCLGSVYSWSIFRIPLENELGLSSAQSLLPFTFVLIFYAGFMPLAGLYMKHWGTRKTAAIGGILVGAGYLLASHADSLLTLVLAYGVLGGAGIGIAYGVPMLVVASWFPQRKGLAVGLTIVGFGLSPLVTAPLAHGLMEKAGVRSTLQTMGIGYMVLILLLALLMKLPERTHSEASDKAVQESAGAGVRGLLREPAFYGLWLCYTLGTLIGLSAIGISSPVGQELIGMNASLAAGSVSLFALFNGLSRPLFGWLTDTFPPVRITILSYGIILLACGLMLTAGPGDVTIFRIAFCLFWFCLGGWLAMAPTMTLRFFPPANYAANYGVVFTAYGCGALIGTLLTGKLHETFGSYQAVFTAMAVLAALGIIISSITLRGR